MRAPDLLKRIGLFAVVFAVVFGGSVAVLGGGSSGTPSAAPGSEGVFTGDDLVASVPAEAGEIDLQANASGKVVLIDASHGASIDREQLAPVQQSLTESGAEVRILAAQQRGRTGAESAFNASLRSADAIVILGAEQQYSKAQVAGLERFGNAGGRILVVKEPPQMDLTWILFIGSRERQEAAPLPLTPLMSRFGIAFGNGYLYNMEDYDTNYRNVYGVPRGNSTLTEDVDRLVFHESTPVQGGTPVVRATEGTELSQTRTTDQYGLVARSGNLIAIGDSSVLGQGYYRRADNEIFVGNLLEFLVSGEKSPENAPAPPETNSTASKPTPPRPRP